MSLRDQLHRDAERIVLKPALYERLDRSTSAPNRGRSRALAVVTLALLASVIALGTVSMTGNDVARPASSSLPEPDVHIVDPAPGLDPRLAAFSGTWQGVWDGILPSRFVVERIDAKTAQVVYVWGRGHDPNLQPGWRRFTAGVVGSGRIEWGRNTPDLTGRNEPCDAHGDPCATVRFMFTMHKDLQAIDGRRDVDWHGESFVNTVVMRHAEPASSVGRAVQLALGSVFVVGVIAWGLFLRRRRIA